MYLSSNSSEERAEPALASLEPGVEQEVQGGGAPEGGQQGHVPVAVGLVLVSCYSILGASELTCHSAQPSR